MSPVADTKNPAQPHPLGILRIIFRLLRDIGVSLVFALCIVVLLAVALLVLAALPILLAFWIMGRFLYWLASRLPMWINPNDVGRLHRWPRLVNVLVIAGIGGLIWLAIRHHIDGLSNGYVEFLVGWVWTGLGWLIPTLADAAHFPNCGQTIADGCKSLVTGWMPGEAWRTWTAVTLLIVVVLALLWRVTSDAARICKLERE